MSLQSVSYWLLPGRAAQAVVDQLSDQASRGIDSSRLPAHLTLHSEHVSADHGVRVERVIDQLQWLADHHQSVLLRPRSIEAKPMFTQSLVLRFDANATQILQPLLAQFRDPLRPSSIAASDDQLDPHVSLLYSQAPLDVRRELAQQLPLPTDLLLFDRVGAVQHPRSIHSPTDIASFTLIETLPLTSSS